MEAEITYLYSYAAGVYEYSLRPPYFKEKRLDNSSIRHYNQHQLVATNLFDIIFLLESIYFFTNRLVMTNLL